MDPVNQRKVFIDEVPYNKYPEKARKQISRLQVKQRQNQRFTISIFITRGIKKIPSQFLLGNSLQKTPVFKTGFLQNFYDKNLVRDLIIASKVKQQIMEQCPGADIRNKGVFYDESMDYSATQGTTGFIPENQRLFVEVTGGTKAVVAECKRIVIKCLEENAKSTLNFGKDKGLFNMGRGRYNAQLGAMDDGTNDRLR